jgi:UDP-N-acetyl-D-mannosaminuronic acid dehydrogenase
MSNIMNINKEDVNSIEKCRNYTVSIIECGKIGVPHAFLLAEAGFNVLGVSTNPHTLKLLKKGKTPFFKIYRTLGKHAREGTFTAYSEVRKATAESDIIIIALRTKIDRRKKPDYSLLETTCKEVGLSLKKGSLVLFVSATGPGIIENFLREVLEKASGLKAGKDFGLASSPIQADSLQRLSKLSNYSRVVGAINDSSLRTASLILSKITKSDIIEVSNITTAEAINLFHNANNETRQAQVNELAVLCEGLKIDFIEVLKAINKNHDFQLPLPGIINSSARGDFYMLQEEAENANLNLHLPHLARKINDEIPEYTFRLVKDALKVCGKTIRRAKVSILGISRHPNIKEPPGTLTKKIINLLKRKMRTVQIYDPFFSKKELTELGLEAEKLSKVVEKTDCVVILTGHSKFERLSLKRVKLLAKKSPAIVDIGHVIDPLKAEKYGFVYRGLGRGVWTK